jgi:alpha-L-rhamnosidase
MLKINNITTENLTEGCITDNPQPRFSFKLQSDRPETFLKSASISVNGWEIETTRQISIPYSGETLKPFTSYKVKVEAIDNHGEKAEAETIFQTGKLEQEWQANWISDLSFKFTEKKTTPKPLTFRKEVVIKGKVRKAWIASTALGIYDLYWNGKKIGLDYFMPGFTDYKNQLQYQVYDVSDHITNSGFLEVVVAGGWAVGAFTYKRKNRIYADRQALLTEIYIEYDDGRIDIIGTDETWEVTADGRYRMAEFYNGETYDASFDSRKIKWKKAGFEKIKINPNIIAHYGAPVRAHENLTPISCKRSSEGTLIYDFGQNFAGVIHAVIRGTKGQKITFRHSEVLQYGKLHTELLRSANAEAVYICAEGEQTYSPRLTYMGFRYVEVKGIEETNIQLTALALYSNLEQNGEFNCSDSRLNQLQNNIVWGAKSNFMDIPTDCPQRDERMGWTGDIALFSNTACYNFNMSRFLEKWLMDVKSEQRRGGAIPETIPHIPMFGKIESMFPVAIAYWGDSCILVPWAEYMARGDIDILRNMYPVMKKYLKACKFWAELLSVGKQKRIWKASFQYGDWCAPDGEYKDWIKKGKWTATACLMNSNKIVAKVADILKEDRDKEYYTKLSDETAEAYLDVFTDGHGKLHEEFQTGYVLPIYYGIFQGKEKKLAVENLVQLVRANNYCIGTGFPGTPYILFALADNGHEEVAFRMLLNEQCPSWLYQVKSGATTIWERWDGINEDGEIKEGDMISFNHYASGAVGDFLYRRILGIEPLEAGYKKFQIKPLLGGELTWASGEVDTPYGKIYTRWEIQGQNITVNVKVPVGTTCELYLPNNSQKMIGSGIYSFAVNTNISCVEK